MNNPPIKIVMIGPESTGKTTLSRQLSDYFNSVWVEEYARTYISHLQRPYAENDLLEIAKGQIQAEEQALLKDYPILFFDTDLLVLKVWSLNAYQKCNTYILEQIKKREYDLYFLCGIDIPWEYDEQREHPHMRQYFYHIYKKELIEANKPFIELRGDKNERLNNAIRIIQERFQQRL